MASRVYGSEFRVWGLGFRFEDLACGGVGGEEGGERERVGRHEGEDPRRGVSSRHVGGHHQEFPGRDFDDAGVCRLGKGSYAEGRVFPGERCLRMSV